MTAQVSQVWKTKWSRNPISGHVWPEYSFIAHWKISGGYSLGQIFSSERAAQEHADWLNTLYKDPP